MLKKITIFISCLIALPEIAGAATCSRINLTKCLDSACAINISGNPAARCQYCGTSDAGTPSTAMRSIGAGASSKNTISAKELKSAPTDPGERYAWATEKCLNIVQNCTTEDVDEAYDPLIEKSCTAAGLAQDMASLQKKSATNKKTESTCTNEITVCITDDKKCGSDYSKCKEDSAFDGFFATCSTQSSGCTSFLNAARETISLTRKNTLSNASANIDAIVNAHKKSREQKLSSINSGCKNNSDFDKCVESVCKNNTLDNCENGKAIANALCEFYKTACTRIK